LPHTKAEFTRNAVNSLEFLKNFVFIATQQILMISDADASETNETTKERFLHSLGGSTGDHGIRTRAT
jgi:hypothetical protein